MNNIEINEEKVKKKLSELNISKSPGPDSMHPRILHDLCEELAKPITIIFRNSIKAMEIPNEWQDGCITALFKKGNRKSTSNYRPVSLTCILCKVMEQFMRPYSRSHEQKYVLLSKAIWLYLRKIHNVTINTVLEKWTEILDNGGSLDCVYLDFMKTFDKVPHHRILKN